MNTFVFLVIFVAAAYSSPALWPENAGDYQHDFNVEEHGITHFGEKDNYYYGDDEFDEDLLSHGILDSQEEKLNEFKNVNIYKFKTILACPKLPQLCTSLCSLLYDSGYCQENTNICVCTRKYYSPNGNSDTVPLVE